MEKERVRPPGRSHMKWIGQPMCIVCRIRTLTCPSEADCARRLFVPFTRERPGGPVLGCFRIRKGLDLVKLHMVKVEFLYKVNKIVK